MKKRLIIVLSLVIITIIAVSTFATIEIYTPFSTTVASKKPFYVGVTYCGNTVAEAETLIDKVRNYTNLFVLQSGQLEADTTDINEIGDYAIFSGLHYMVYSETANPWLTPAWLNMAKQQWGDMFLGVYYGDEPGGKILDGGYVNLTQQGSDEQVMKLGSTITITQANGTTISYLPDGSISMIIEYNSIPANLTNISFPNSPKGNFPSGNTTISIPLMPNVNQTIVNYAPNGSITIRQDPNILYTEENGSSLISQMEPYNVLLSQNPFQNYEKAAEQFINGNENTLELVRNQSVSVFTSDYGLYWFDYLAGYNVVFAELFGGQTGAQTLALVRGAADMQNKSWGVMIEPASQSPLSLQTGGQMYNEMRQAYENGAEYTVVFNYSPSGNGTGLLQNEQFASIQKFWNDVMQNPKVTNNVTGQDALVLPQNYGWGMRNQNDTIWGIWQPDNSSQQVWNAVQSSLAKYGSKLDIVYDDPAYPTAGRYQHVYYWNQTF